MLFFRMHLDENDTYVVGLCMSESESNHDITPDVTQV